MYDVAEHILGAYDQELYTYATNQLQSRGIDVVTGTMIEKVEEQNLHLKGGAVVPYGILLWVAGNKSVQFVDDLDVKKTEQGLSRMLTDEYLRVKKTQGGDTEAFTNVFALGDAADIEGDSLPTTAEVAVQKANYLVQRLNGERATTTPKMTAFTYREKGLVTYIGSRDGIGQGWSTQSPYSGSQAWATWRAGSFAWSRTWRNWANIGWAMLVNFVFGKHPTGL